MDRQFKSATGVNRYLKELHLANEALSEDAAGSLLASLTTSITSLPNTDKEKAHAITALSNLLHFLPRSPGYGAFFSNLLFLSSLVSYAIHAPLEDPPYVVLNSHLRGDFDDPQEKTLAPSCERFMAIFAKNTRVLENVPLRIRHYCTSAAAEATAGGAKPPNLIRSSVEFVALLLHAAADPRNASCGLSALIIMRQLDFALIYVNQLLGKNLLSAKLVAISDGMLIRDLVRLTQNIARVQVDHEHNHIHRMVVSQLLLSIKSFNHVTIAPGKKNRHSAGSSRQYIRGLDASDKESLPEPQADLPDQDDALLFEKCGLTRDPAKHIFNRYDLTDVLAVLQFITHPKLSYDLKLKCKQQLFLLLGPDAKKRFPINTMLLEVARILNSHSYQTSDPSSPGSPGKTPSVPKFLILNGSSIFQLLMFKAFEYWDKSRAQYDNDEDIQVVLNLIRTELSCIEHYISKSSHSDPHNYKDLLSEIRNYSLKFLDLLQVMDIQLEFFKQSQYGQVTSSEQEVLNFDDNLIENLKFFIINQRFDELFRGTLCYTRDPTTISSDKVRDLCRMYVALATNRGNLLYQSVPPGTAASGKDSKHTKPAQYLDRTNSTEISLRNVKRLIINDDVASDKSSSLGMQHDNFSFAGSFSSSAKTLYSDKKPQVSHGTARLITLSSRNKYTKIGLVNQHDEVAFAFYTDNEHNAMLWIDSLNFLINSHADSKNRHLQKLIKEHAETNSRSGRKVQDQRLNFANVADETKLHMQHLFDIRKTLQFSPMISKQYSLDDTEKLHDFCSKGEGETANTEGQSVGKRTIGEIFETIALHRDKKALARRRFASIMEAANVATQKALEVPAAAAAVRPEAKSADTTAAAVEGDDFEYNYDELVDVAQDFYYTSGGSYRLL